MTSSLSPARVDPSITTCMSVGQDVFAFVDGELTPAAAADVTIHLARCDACRVRAVAAERLVARLRRAARTDALPAAPPALRSHVEAMLAAWRPVPRAAAE